MQRGAAVQQTSGAMVQEGGVDAWLREECLIEEAGEREKDFNFKLSGNEAYSTKALLLLTKIMLRSELHCQKF